jgi:nitroreductase
MTSNNIQNQNLMPLIKERRSVRIFNGSKIPEGLILQFIEAAIWAPTGCNNQELRFLILDKEEEIQGMMPFKPFFRGVSTMALVFCDMSLPMSRILYRQNRSERHLCYVDTGLALANMILFAKSQGVDSCIFNLSEYHMQQRKKRKNLGQRMIDTFKRKFGLHRYIEENFEHYLRNQLRIPSHLKITCGVAFGYAKIKPDVLKAVHGGRKVMRDKLENYIIRTH